MCMVFFLPVLEYSLCILSLLSSLPLRKTNQPFIVKRGWAAQIVSASISSVAWRDQRQVRTLNSDPVA